MTGGEVPGPAEASRRRAVTVYLDWNVCSTWADADPVPTPFSRLWRLTQAEAVEVLFSREHVREACAGWTSGLTNQRRAVQRLCLLDALSWNLVELRADNEADVQTNTPFEVLSSILGEWEERPDITGVLEDAGVLTLLRVTHDQALDKIAASGTDVAEWRLGNVDACPSAEALAFEAQFNLIGALVAAGRRAPFGLDPRQLNNLSASEVFRFILRTFEDAGVDLFRGAPDLPELLRRCDRFAPEGMTMRPRAAQANAMLNVMGFHRDGARVGGRSMFMDSLHVEYGSRCDYFVTHDRALLRRFEVVRELLELPVCPVAAHQAGAWLDTLEAAAGLM